MQSLRACNRKPIVHFFPCFVLPCLNYLSLWRYGHGYVPRSIQSLFSCGTLQSLGSTSLFNFFKNTLGKKLRCIAQHITFLREHLNCIKMINHNASTGGCCERGRMTPAWKGTRYGHIVSLSWSQVFWNHQAPAFDCYP